MRSDEKTKQGVVFVALFIMFVGVIGVISSAYLSAKLDLAVGSLGSAVVSALLTISISLIGFSIFSFAVDTKNWREYFGERLKEIVIEQEYLRGLDKETLKSLQTNVLKAQFKNPGIDKEGGFLDYFNRNVHRYISEPYREDVSAEVLTSISENGDFIVKDKVTYTCRSSAGKIQQEIGLKIDDGELQKVLSVKVIIQYPQHHPSAGEKVELYQKKDGDLHAQLINGLKVSLDKYESIDGLIVIIEQEYEVLPWKFQYWQMAHPTRNFDITIVYPKDSSIQFKTLVLDDAVSQITQDGGYLKFKYDSWLLPQSGLAWLIKK